MEHITSPGSKPSEDALPMKSVRTALAILNQFASADRGYGVAEIADLCGLTSSHVSKVLAAFSESGLLVQDAVTRRYAVGPRLFAIGSRYLAGSELCHAAMPVLRDLVAQTGHSSRLSVPDGDKVLFLVGIEGPMFLNTGWRSGTRMPLHATAAGRILLAFMDEEVAADLLQGERPALTLKTVTDLGTLRRSLKDIRTNGIAFQHGESIPDLTGVAVPLFGIRKSLIGTLSVVLPSHVHTQKDEARLRNVLHHSARTLSQRMGCDVYPFGH